MKNRTLVYALAGLGAIALLFVKRKRPKGFNRRDALRLAPLTADAVAIGKSYRSYPDRVKTLVDFQVAAGLDAMADADGYYGPSARGALVYWLGEQGIDASRAPPALYGSGTKPYRLPVVPPDLEIKRYTPHSAEAIALFEKAAPLAFGPSSPNGVPTSWASEPGLHNILAKESRGFVGIPNYTYRDRATQESEWNGVLDELREGQITATSSAMLKNTILPDVLVLVFLLRKQPECSLILQTDMVLPKTHGTATAKWGMRVTDGCVNRCGLFPGSANKI